MEDRYADIIHLPRPVSGRHARMSMIDRGAQFSPFAALTGYEAVIQETARLTEQCTELDEGGIALLDEKLRFLARDLDSQPQATFTVFRPDEWKQGGSYVKITGRVKKIDLYEQAIVLTDGQSFYIDQIYDIE